MQLAQKSHSVAECPLHTHADIRLVTGKHDKAENSSPRQAKAGRQGPGKYMKMRPIMHWPLHN